MNTNSFRLPPPLFLCASGLGAGIENGARPCTDGSFFEINAYETRTRLILYDTQWHSVALTGMLWTFLTDTDRVNGCQGVLEVQSPETLLRPLEVLGQRGVGSPGRGRNLTLIAVLGLDARYTDFEAVSAIFRTVADRDLKNEKCEMRKS